MTNSETPNPQVQPPVKFNSSLAFPHEPPYASLFAERVPLLQAFHLALANCVRGRHHRAATLSGRLNQWLTSMAPSFRAAECGVYTGSSLVACAQAARNSGLSFRIHGLDTFVGLPPLSAMDESLSPPDAKYRHNTLFADTSVEMVRENLATAGLDGNVMLHQGLFSVSLLKLPDQTYHFVNIDCDLYEPHLECLEYFYPRLVCGGIMFFDDYYSVEFPMAGKAIDTFMSDKPEELMHLRFGENGPNRTKAFFVKY